MRVLETPQISIENQSSEEIFFWKSKFRDHPKKHSFLYEYFVEGIDLLPLLLQISSSSTWFLAALVKMLFAGLIFVQ